jgi:hypothetical protein
MRIRIGLPDDRDFAGRLEVLDDDGTVVFGPVPAAGRAHDESAAAHGNPSRNPLRAYGDTPLGTFAVRGVIPSGPGTEFEDESLGRHGVVVLEPVSGQAALADAHGRFRLFIQGGRDGDESLRATAGAIRLRDQDQRQLVALLRLAPGRLLCDVVPTPQRGAGVSLTPPPLDHDPPALPGRSSVSRRRLKSVSRDLATSVRARAASYVPRTFVVVPERSGSGGTAYGGGGGGFDPGDAGDTGFGTGTGFDTTDVGPLPVTGEDTAPTPGSDLNPPSDDTAVTLGETGGSDLLSASPTGTSDPNEPEQGGWITGPQPTDPYTGVPATGDPLAPFTGQQADPFTGSPSDVENPNPYTGGPSVDPSTDSAGDSPGASLLLAFNGPEAAASSAADATVPVSFEPDKPIDHSRPSSPEELQALQELMDAAAKMDAEIAASHAAQQASQDAPPPDPNVSPGRSSSGEPAIPGAAPADLSNAQPTNPGGFDPTTVFSRSDDNLPWTPAGAAGALSSQGYIPPFESQGVPSFARPLGGGIQANQWRGFLGETSFEANSLFRGRFQTDLNLRPFTTASGAPGNPGFFPVLDYQNVITGNPTSVATSLRGNVNAPGDQNRLNFYRDKYREMIGERNPGKLTNAAQNLNITPNDVAQRASLAINSDDVGAARDYISHDVRNNPGNYPPGWDPNAPSRQIIGNDLTTPQLQNLQNARRGLGNLPAGDVARLTSPEALGVSRKGWGGALGGSAVRGGGVGAGIATSIDAVTILLDPGSHPDAARELATTGVLGGGSGAAGGALETAFNARVSQSLLTAAASGEEVAASNALLGRVAGGGVGGGPAAAIFTVGQMALSDQQYTAEDYEAKGTRAAVSGALSGALAAGVVGAIWGSEVPILGNIVGFAVGFLGYMAVDYLFGDTVEGAVRGGEQPVGDFDSHPDPSGFLG